MIKNRELECNPPEISFSELCFKMLTNVSSSSSELQKSMFPTGLSTESNLNDPGAISLSITEEINNNNMGEC
uniref:Uncharacterized protein n=1 Tax=Caenorhabditis japonica TaxID=281687 RepID=A0A8R1ISZ6_CAEJA